MVTLSESSAASESEQGRELERRRLDLKPRVAVVVNSSFILQVHLSQSDFLAGYPARKIGIFATADTPIRYANEPITQTEGEIDQPDRITYVIKTLGARNNVLLVGQTKITSLRKPGETFPFEIESPAPVTFYVLGHSLKPQDKSEAQELLGTKSVVHSTNPS